jgi:hypothetical protein
MGYRIYAFAQSVFGAVNAHEQVSFVSDVSFCQFKLCQFGFRRRSSVPS